MFHFMFNYLKNKLRHFIIETVREAMKNGGIETTAEITVSVDMDSTLSSEKMADIIGRSVQQQLNRGKILVPNR